MSWVCFPKNELGLTTEKRKPPKSKTPFKRSWVWLHLLKGGIFSYLKKACKKEKIEKKRCK
jgi:hypothetical protein